MSARSRSLQGPLSRPSRQRPSKTFTRKADAERFVLQVESRSERGNWLDPRDADMPVAVWAETFLSLCRRLAPTTQETYRRDLEQYVLPRFGSYRLGRLPAEEIEEWLNDEVAAGVAPSRSTGTTAHCAACCRSPWRSRRSSTTRATASIRPGCRIARWSSSTGTRQCASPRRTTPNGSERSSTSRSTAGCAGASSSGCAAPASTSDGWKCGSPSNSSSSST